MATDAMTEEFRIYLHSCSEDMATQIIGALQQAGSRTVPNAAPSMTTTGSAVAKTEKKQRKKAKSDLEAGGPKRPLNSWMAFRKHYNRVLAPHTQKAISGCLAQLWKADLFTAKWALLAKAYSVVRGCGEKKDAPLDDYFIICAPLIGVIPPEQYLEMMGWQVLPPQDGDPAKVPQLVRIFEPTLDCFDEEHTTTNLGVDDLVAACVAAGFGPQSNSGPQNASAHGSLTMASRPNGNTNNNLHQTLVTAPPLPAVNFDPSPLPSAHAVGQEILDEAYNTLQSDGWNFGLGAQVEQAFDPNASTEDLWDAYDLTTVNIPTPEGMPVEQFDIDEWLEINGQ
ncbi:hypothetical protein CERZMDRAFT_110793 [Cercospora zeae-maydis SCOH1-5]|uniref:Mating-type protein MAT-1 n=3 Tax=Cercospora zeae-maydis TaxID=135779 RepID=A0A6A6FMI6_9PEZI|nr:putative mating type 1-1 protein [Cercospora zeae-maydis]KAF2214514.1 hypothetical protein CERZMDRAFT_110793 [Cercospora zeae-maydis SCOH1-5]